MQSCDRTKHGFALAGKGQNELETNDKKHNNRATYVGCSSIKIATIKYINVAVDDDDDDDDAAAVVASAAAVDFVLFEIIPIFVCFF